MNDVSFAGQLLVVDDDEMNRDILARRRAQDGRAVTTISDRFEALDLMMPRMNSYPMLEATREEKRLRRQRRMYAVGSGEQDHGYRFFPSTSLPPPQISQRKAVT